MVLVGIKRQFCNYSSCTILQFLPLITAAIIEIWHNQSVINLNDSLINSFGIKGRTHLRALIAEDTFLHISSTCLHQVS